MEKDHTVQRILPSRRPSAFDRTKRCGSGIWGDHLDLVGCNVGHVVDAVQGQGRTAASPSYWGQMVGGPVRRNSNQRSRRLHYSLTLHGDRMVWRQGPV